MSDGAVRYPSPTVHEFFSIVSIYYVQQNRIRIMRLNNIFTYVNIIREYPMYMYACNVIVYKWSLIRLFMHRNMKNLI